MKKFFILTAILFYQVSLFSQKVEIIADVGSGPQSQIITGETMEIEVDAAIKTLTEFNIKASAFGTIARLKIEAKSVDLKQGIPSDFLKSDDGKEIHFEFNSNIINKQISITPFDSAGKPGTSLKFRFVQTAGGPDSVEANKKDTLRDGLVSASLKPLSEVLAEMLQGYIVTDLGLVQNTAGASLTKKQRNIILNTTHIFFDEYGNSLLGAIPQGISNRNYTAHIIYQGYADGQRDVRYSVKQKAGSFNGSLLINNANALRSLPNKLQGSEEGAPFDAWEEVVYPLGIATDDLIFDIIATTVQDKKVIKAVLETQTIHMAPVYHVSMDIGLLRTELENPTFDLVDRADGSGDKVVKETDRSPKGVVTIMATFYASPIVMLEKLFESKTSKKSIPKYKMTGRTFFDDHSFIERIYPALGVSVSSKSFDNLFFGFNWELARGLSFFAGGHWGKVNTFEMPGFETGETGVTDTEFEFYKNTKWKLAWAYGAKLDISIITSLF